MNLDIHTCSHKEFEKKGLAQLAEHAPDPASSYSEVWIIDRYRGKLKVARTKEAVYADLHDFCMPHELPFLHPPIHSDDHSTVITWYYDMSTGTLPLGEAVSCQVQGIASDKIWVVRTDICWAAILTEKEVRGLLEEIRQRRGECMFVDLGDDKFVFSRDSGAHWNLSAFAHLLPVTETQWCPPFACPHCGAHVLSYCVDNSHHTASICNNGSVYLNGPLNLNGKVEAGVGHFLCEACGHPPLYNDSLITNPLQIHEYLHGPFNREQVEKWPEAGTGSER